MHVHRAQPVTVFAPAKLNLFLEVLGKRSDGYHEISTLMVPVGLCDTLSFEATSSEEIDCVCHWHSQRAALRAGAAVIPSLADNNLAVRAARLLREAAGISAGGRMNLVKRIPLEAGLAGGSSDAAAALLAANRAWGLDWPVARLAPIAAQLGSDIPFFFGRGPALCGGRGERVARQCGLAPLHFVIVHPPAGLSTAAVYSRCRPGAHPHDAEPLLAAWRRGDTAAVAKNIFNRLEEPAAELSPWVARLRAEFDRLDFLGHQMTGSGSAYFGVCRHATHARRLAAALRNRGLAQVFSVAGLN